LVFYEKIGKREVNIEGANVEEVIEKFLLMFKDELIELGAIDSNDPLKLHPSILVILNGRDVRFLEGGKTKVNHKDILMIIPPVAGG
jgi:molybdopterin converting factor small subunit